MNWGKVGVTALLLSSVVAAVGIWWTQTRQYWREDPTALITMTDANGAQSELVVRELQAIRSESSPLGFRACFQTDLTMDQANAALMVDGPEPTVPPPWFDCFDPRGIADGVRAGEALAFIGAKNVAYGVDRVVAVFADGRGYAWHELNNCGHKAYDGTVVGENCPDRASFEGTF